jgi:hypothetical protein
MYNTYGWRRSEPLDELRVQQVDLLNQTIDLNPGATKNREARVIKMTREIHAVTSMWVEGKGPDDRVFTREDDKLIGDFRKTWYKMRCKVGLSEKDGNRGVPPLTKNVKDGADVDLPILPFYHCCPRGRASLLIGQTISHPSQPSITWVAAGW